MNDNEYNSSEFGLSKNKEYQQFEPKKETTSLQNNIEEPSEKDKEETLKNNIEDTNPYSMPLKNENENENEIEIIIDNKKIEAIPTLDEVKANLESISKNNIENIEEEVIDGFNTDNINTTNGKKNIRKKDKPKPEKSETDKTVKQNVPKTKNLIKSVELFMNSYRCYFNYRCKRYGLKKLKKTKDFEKLFGNEYKRHKKFLKRSMKVTFGFRNRHNKIIINDMIHKVKDVIFTTFMNLRVEDAYKKYKNNYPYLDIKKSRLFLSHFISLKQAINDKKEKEQKRKEKKEDEKELEDLDILKEEAENFIDSINEEREIEQLKKDN